MGTSFSAVKEDLTSNPRRPPPGSIPIRHHGALPIPAWKIQWSIRLVRLKEIDGSKYASKRTKWLTDRLCVGYIGDQAQQPDSEEP